MDPIAINLGVEATRRLAMSARPDAPQVAEPPPKPGRGRGPGLVLRRATAARLRRLADRLEPQPSMSTLR